MSTVRNLSAGNVSQIMSDAQNRVRNLQQMSDQSRSQRGLTTSEGSGVIGGMGQELRREEVELLRQINYKLTPEPG